MLVALISALSIMSLEARQWQAPSPLRYGYAYSHFPFMPPTEENECNRCWWFDMINPWAAGEAWHANKAFISNDTTNRQDLSGLFFGQTSFTLANILSPGSTSPFFPLAGIITLSPTFDSTQNTAWFGLNIEKHFGCEGQWHVGARFRIPFRDIKNTLDSCCQLESDPSEFYAVNANELVCNSELISSTALILNSFAYRLDFLSELPLLPNGTGKFVNYANPAGTIAGDITIGGIDVTDADSAVPPVQVIAIPIGLAPTGPFALREVQGGASDPASLCLVSDQTSVDTLVSGGFFVPASGLPVVTGDRYVFDNATHLATTYLAGGLGTDPIAQAGLWVVPSAAGAEPAFDIVGAARTIEAEFNAIVNSVDISVVSLLTQTGITFNTQRTAGPGDFDAEIYVHRDFCGCWGDWFAEGIFGATFPTAHRDNSPNLLLLVPKGNNRHYEVKVGGIFGWQPTDWVALKADAFYSWALKRNEKVAAPFMGATVKNIGPTITAKTSWGYFYGDFDVTFMVPCVCPQLGIDVGYQPYVKQKDKISLSQTTAVDLLGNTNGLDPSVLQMNTKQISHTIKGEVFYQACSWQLFAGFNHSVAGKNAPYYADWYLGLEVYW